MVICFFFIQTRNIFVRHLHSKHPQSEFVFKDLESEQKEKNSVGSTLHVMLFETKNILGFIPIEILLLLFKIKESQF